MTTGRHTQVEASSDASHQAHDAEADSKIGECVESPDHLGFIAELLQPDVRSVGCGTCLRPNRSHIFRIWCDPCPFAFDHGRKAVGGRLVPRRVHDHAGANISQTLNLTDWP